MGTVMVSLLLPVSPMGTVGVPSSVGDIMLLMTGLDSMSSSSGENAFQNAFQILAQGACEHEFEILGIRGL